MKVLTSTAALVGAIALVLPAQKIERQTPDTGKIVRVETARDHLTVIELGDTVTMVAVGNQSAFNVERRENKVFVKPAEDGARTNLFIWTNAGRFAYELLPAETVEQMHFAIDQEPPVVAANVSSLSDSGLVESEPPLPADMLTKAVPIILQGDREIRGRVEVALRDLYRDGNRLYLRYAVINHSAHTYQTTRPAAWLLTDVRSPQSLIALKEHQLGERLTRSLKAEQSSRLRLLDADETPQVAAGGHGLGWCIVEEPRGVDRGVSALRLEFAADAKGPVDAVLVLRPENHGQEVADGRRAGE